jgi:hypothetical protein
MAGGAEPCAIGEAYVAAAVRLWKEYVWPHSRAALRQIGLSEKHSAARRVARWIRAKGLRDVSVKDVRHDALGQSIDARQTEELLRNLDQAGWLRKQTAPTGGRPIHRGQANPCLFGAGSAGRVRGRRLPALSALRAFRQGSSAIHPMGQLRKRSRLAACAK